MEILAGERSYYTLLTFVCFKMEMRWRSKPIGKVACSLPFIQKMADINSHKIVNCTYICGECQSCSEFL